MRWVKTTILFVILLGLPALSWYYLKKGADWRISGLEAIANKTPLETDTYQFATFKNKEVNLVEGRFYLASNISATSETEKAALQKLADQFDHRDDLIYLLFGLPSNNTSLDEQWQQVDCSSSPCSRLTAQLFPSGMNAALVDDSLNLRRSYDLLNEEDAHALIEHAAILFPVEKRKKIELIRGKSE